MEKNLFQQAKDAINNLTNMQGNTSQGDKEAARNAIKSAYQEASPEEQEQLEQFEQQLEENDHLS